MPLVHLHLDDKDYVISHAIAGDLVISKLKLVWDSKLKISFIPFPGGETILTCFALERKHKDLKELYKD